MLTCPSARGSMAAMKPIDPRGLQRTVVKVDLRPEAAYLTLSCGHVATCASHFSYREGLDHFCFKCGIDARTGHVETS